MNDLFFGQMKPVERETISGGNRRVFDYWQSLRAGDALPSRSVFCPAQIKSSLSKLMMLQVWPQERVICRLAGTDIVRVIGLDLTGSDIIAATPAEFRAERLTRYSRCLDKLVHRSVRTMPNGAGAAVRAEYLVLPFADTREDGSRLVLLAADWITDHYDDRLHSPTSAFIAPEIAEYLAP